MIKVVCCAVWRYAQFLMDFYLWIHALLTKSLHDAVYIQICEVPTTTYTLTPFPISNILVCIESEMEGLMAEPINIGGKVSSEPSCIVYNTPTTRREKLKALTVCEDLLIDAIQRGVAEKLTAEIFDPATAGGYALYWYTTRYVRKGLYEDGWELSDSNNIALVREPSEGTIIIVCSGDHQTGQIIGDPPKTKRSKGEIFLEVSEIVSTNLFGDDDVETRHVAQPDAKVWLLLHYHVVDRGQQILRA